MKQAIVEGIQINCNMHDKVLTPPLSMDPTHVGCGGD